jgi:hypothetical protein
MSTRLQELYRGAMSSRAPGACVSPEDLLALLRREGAEDRRLVLLDHVMGCQACHREFELLRAIEAAGTTARGSSSVFNISRRLAPLALAASLLLAVGVGLLLRNRGEDNPTRGGAGELVVLAPPPEVAADRPVTFAWRPVRGAQSYRLEILDSTGTAVSQLTRDTTLTLPAGQLQPGSSYQWYVRDASSGSQLGSGLRALRVLRSK